jgi:hypothetical protein
MLILLYTDPLELKITKLLIVTTGESRRGYLSHLLWRCVSMGRDGAEISRPRSSGSWRFHAVHWQTPHPQKQRLRDNDLERRGCLVDPEKLRFLALSAIYADSTIRKPEL